jgi:hypothetical protein
MQQYTGSTVRIWLLSMAVAGLAGCATGSAPETSRVDASAPAPTPVADTAAPTPTPEPVALTRAEPPVTIRESAPLQYVVQPGDTLWGVASRFLARPWQWPEVWFVNDQVANPHLIYPGDVLSLRMIDGRQRVVREAAPELSVVRLGPQVREGALDAAISAIPLGAIQDFLRHPRMVAAEEIDGAPYLLAFGDNQLVAGAGSPAYVKNLPEDAAERWAVVRPEQVIRDPDSDEVLGYAALPVGDYALSEYHAEAALGTLSRSVMEARAGDRLVPVDNLQFDPRFVPRPPANPIDGAIVWIAEERLQATQYQVVAINRGAAHGLVNGHLLTIRQKGRVVDDPHGRGSVQLPPAPIGSLMIFKIREQLAFGLVMDATRPVSPLDRVMNPLDALPEQVTLTGG